MATDDFGGDTVEGSVVRDSITFMKMSVKRDERAFVYLLLATHSRLGLSVDTILASGAQTVLTDENNDNAERLHAALVRLRDALEAADGPLHLLFDKAGFQLYPQERMLLALDYSKIKDQPHLTATLFTALSEVLPVRTA